MDNDKLADTIARLTENGRWNMIMAKELIDALADDIEAANWQLITDHADDAHNLEGALCEDCPVKFDRTEWMAKAKGESC